MRVMSFFIIIPLTLDIVRRAEFFNSQFGSPAIYGPSGSHPWLLKGSEDQWLSVPSLSGFGFVVVNYLA